MSEAVLNAYRENDALVLLSREPDGTLRERRQRAEYSYFLRNEDYRKVERDVRGAERSGRVLRVREEGDFVRVLCRDDDFRRRLWLGFEGSGGGYFEGLGIEAYEIDVHPASRFLVDSLCDIQKPFSGSLDLETDSRVPFSRKEQARILCWNVAREDDERYGGVLEEDSDEAEAELLRDLLFELGQLDQIRCWNGKKFDEPVLRARCRRYGIRVPWGRWLFLDHMECFRKYNAHSAKSGGEKESVALERVAESLGIDTAKKLAVDASKSWDYWAVGGERRRMLFERNAFDAGSMLEIEKKTGYCGLHYAVCATSGCLPDSRSLNALVHVEAFVMRVASQRGVRLPAKKSFGMEKDLKFEQFKGAFVLEPSVGMHFGVHVCDFAGMYPTIIESLNISPEMVVKELAGKPEETFFEVAARLPPGHCVAPRTKAVFRTDSVGILPLVIKTLKDMRRSYNEARDAAVPDSPEWHEADRLSQGCKIAVNSCFGVLSSMFFRWHVREVGESITTTGAWLIESVIEKGVRERQLVPVGSDTDSMMAKNTTSSVFREFVRECNADLLPKLLRTLGCDRCDLKLEYEKSYAIQVITGKKRYCSRLLEYKGMPPKEFAPQVKGLEYVRGDQLRIAREFQFQVVKKLLLLEGMVVREVPVPYPLRAEDFAELVLGWKRRVLEEPLGLRDVVVSQSLKGPPSSYDRGLKQDGAPVAVPLHVAVARVLEERGADVSEGARVEYVVVDGDATPIKAVPAADYQPGIEDRAYLWESKVWPPTRRLLAAAFPDHHWARFDEGKDRGGGRGRSSYLPGQVHLPWWDS